MVIQVPPQMNVSEVGNVLLNNSDIWKNLPPEMIKSIGILITILKAVGIVFLIYLVFLIVRSILNIIEKRRIKKIYNAVLEMDKKLDVLVKKKEKK